MYRSIVQAITTLIDGKANGMRKGWHLYLIFCHLIFSLIKVDERIYVATIFSYFFLK